MALETRLKGYRVARESSSALRSKLVAVKAEFRPASFRSGTERESEVTVGDDDLVEIEFEDGLRLWLTASEYREKLESSKKRAPGSTGPLEVPDSLPIGGDEASERGIVGWVLRSLKIVGVDVAGKTAVQLARLFEDKKEGRKRPGPGLYRCRMVTGDFALEDPPVGSLAGARVLLFVHGTASSTWGSFGELWSPARAATLAGLRKIYGDSVIALEHRSMSESPIANALEAAEQLASRLPDGAELDLVSHSRGGLVGELLCRMNIADGSESFEALDHKLVTDASWLADLDLSTAAVSEAKEALAGESEGLKALAATLGTLLSRGVTVRRFVRVACPALGTTLISRRLDRWVQILANVGRLASAASPLSELVDSLGDFIVAVLKERTAPAKLPGLVAMLPETGFVRMVNNPRRSVASELAVIAGDSDPDKIWKRLLMLIADRFYAGEHDLVVNTGSMYGGAPRQTRKTALCYQQGARVNHFNYFKNADSADAIVTALAVTDFGALAGTAGFEPLRAPEKPIAREVSRGPAGPRPVVFVLPGIMGSELEANGNRVWIDFVDLFTGGLEALHIGATGISPLRPYAGYYGELVEYLADSHKVIAFPFDWRLEPEKEADRLAGELSRAVVEAEAAGQPVRLVAHSMGGLIARTMIARHPEIWRDMTRLPGARLVMLGTPNGGSYSINELLVAQSGTLCKLALLDVRHSHAELLRIIARFPGVLAMLPRAAHEDYLSVDTWERYAKGGKANWVLPDASDLERVRAFHALIESSPIDPERMIYVAGQARQTLVGMFRDSKDGRIRFRATTRGDGRVPWDTGIPSLLRAWYAPNVEHGDLSADVDLFPAILDLLQTGTTSRLSHDEPVSRDAAREFVVEPEIEECLPDERSLAAEVLGAAAVRPRKRARRLPLDVKVVHGHLRFADYPVLVGHYKGDTIVSAESDLDDDLDGRLRARHRLGLYPDDIGSHEVALKPRRDVPDAFSGAIVVGLGMVGELGVGKLVETVARGALAYAVRIAERAEDRRRSDPRGKDVEPEVQEIGISSLLVGTNAGGVNVSDSLLAVLEGVERANEMLFAAKRPVRIATVQLIELFLSRALVAIQDLDILGRLSRLKGAIKVPATIETRRGARRQIVFKEPDGWWDRLQIKGKGEAERPDDGSLRFVALTQRARAEARVVATQRKLVDQFVRNTIRDTRHDSDLTRTLFELLLPNEFKEQAPDRRSIVLVLDEESARYPWELLENRYDGAGQPLALNRGLLRQLETAVFRDASIRSLGNAALVVGDPILPEQGPLKRLPGARDEASAVADVLDRSHRFRVTRRIEASAKEIVQAFFAEPYRIVHLAGHGVYEWQEPAKVVDEKAESSSTKPAMQTVTGMVIGDGVYLTPAEVKQMRRVPDLVFINCCHLGYIEDRERRAEEEVRQDEGRRLAPLRDYHLFAANVATEFIRMGVRAVIAAGWAVNDAAAKTFAQAFYGAMVAAEPLGKAVESARAETHRRHPYANTWGAYQCYGDQEFQLVEREQRGAARRRDYASVEVMINRMESVEAECETRGSKDIGAQLAELETLGETLDKSAWRGNGRAWAALGRAWNRAFQFEAAIDCFHEAIGCEDGGLTVHDLEQLSNCESRAAVAQWKAGRAGLPVDALRARTDVAISRLQALLTLPIGMRKDKQGNDVPAGQPETRERFSLLGSAHKRKAWIAAPSERGAPLEEMRDWYRKAADRGRQAGSILAYPVLNWIAALIVLDWHGMRASADDRKRAEAELAELREALERQVSLGRDLWDRASLADLKLTADLWSGDLEKHVDELLADYDEVRHLASPREFESVREHIDFLLDMARDRDVQAAAGLERLTRGLEAASPASGPLPTEGEAREAGETATPATARARRHKVPRGDRSSGAGKPRRRKK